MEDKNVKPEIIDRVDTCKCWEYEIKIHTCCDKNDLAGGCKTTYEIKTLDNILIKIDQWNEPEIDVNNEFTFETIDLNK